MEEFSIHRKPKTVGKIPMMKFLHRCWFEEDGQDLIEYTLLLAFVALASAALFLGVGRNVNGVWDEGSEVLHDAKRASS